MIKDKLFQTAFEYKKTRLWNKLRDSQIFAIKHSDGTIGYCCVMGKANEYNALAIYDDITSIPTYYYNQSDEDLPEIEMENFTRQSCVSVVFSNKSELLKEDLKDVTEYCKKNDIQLRGRNAYPEFKKFKPYSFPWYIEDEEDKIRLLEGMEAAIEVSKKLKGKRPYEFIEGKYYDRQIPLLEKTVDGYIWSFTNLPPFKAPEYPKGSLNKIAIPIQLSKAPKLNTDWICHIFLSSEPVQEDGAPFFPFVMLIVDDENEVILGAYLSSNPCDYTEEFTKYFTSAIIQTGKPRYIYVSNNRTEAFLSDLSTQLGIKLRHEEYNELIDAIINEFFNKASDNNDPSELMNELFDVFEDPDEVEELRDEDLKLFSSFLGQEIFPPHIEEIIIKEMKRRGIN